MHHLHIQPSEIAAMTVEQIDRACGYVDAIASQQNSQE